MNIDRVDVAFGLLAQNYSRVALGCFVSSKHASAHACDCLFLS